MILLLVLLVVAEERLKMIDKEDVDDDLRLAVSSTE